MVRLTIPRLTLMISLGFALDKYLESQEICGPYGMDFPFSHHYQGRIALSTVNTQSPGVFPDTYLGMD